MENTKLLWFVCKYCNSAFQIKEKLIEHKTVAHADEIKKLKKKLKKERHRSKSEHKKSSKSKKSKKYKRIKDVSGGESDGVKESQASESVVSTSDTTKVVDGDIEGSLKSFPESEPKASTSDDSPVQNGDSSVPREASVTLMSGIDESVEVAKAARSVGRKGKKGGRKKKTNTESPEILSKVTRSRSKSVAKDKYEFEDASHLNSADKVCVLLKKLTPQEIEKFSRRPQSITGVPEKIAHEIKEEEKPEVKSELNEHDGTKGNDMVRIMPKRSLTKPNYKSTGIPQDGDVMKRLYCRKTFVKTSAVAKKNVTNTIGPGRRSRRKKANSPSKIEDKIIPIDLNTSTEDETSFDAAEPNVIEVNGIQEVEINSLAPENANSSKINPSGVECGSNSINNSTTAESANSTINNSTTSESANASTDDSTTEESANSSMNISTATERVQSPVPVPTIAHPCSKCFKDFTTLKHKQDHEILCSQFKCKFCRVICSDRPAVFFHEVLKHAVEMKARSAAKKAASSAPNHEIAKTVTRTVELEEELSNTSSDSRSDPCSDIQNNYSPQIPDTSETFEDLDLSKVIQATQAVVAMKPVLDSQQKDVSVGSSIISSSTSTRDSTPATEAVSQISPISSNSSISKVETPVINNCPSPESKQKPGDDDDDDIAVVFEKIIQSPTLISANTSSSLNESNSKDRVATPTSSILSYEFKNKMKETNGMLTVKQVYHSALNLEPQHVNEDTEPEVLAVYPARDQRLRSSDQSRPNPPPCNDKPQVGVPAVAPRHQASSHQQRSPAAPTLLPVARVADVRQVSRDVVPSVTPDPAVAEQARRQSITQHSPLGQQAIVNTRLVRVRSAPDHTPDAATISKLITEMLADYKGPLARDEPPARESIVETYRNLRPEVTITPVVAVPEPLPQQIINNREITIEKVAINVLPSVTQVLSPSARKEPRTAINVLPSVTQVLSPAARKEPRTAINVLPSVTQVLSPAARKEPPTEAALVVVNVPEFVIQVPPVENASISKIPEDLAVSPHSNISESAVQEPPVENVSISKIPEELAVPLHSNVPESAVQEPPLETEMNQDEEFPTEAALSLDEDTTVLEDSSTPPISSVDENLPSGLAIIKVVSLKSLQDTEPIQEPLAVQESLDIPDPYFSPPAEPEADESFESVDQKIMCEECGKFCRSPVLLLRHRVVRHAPKPFKCSQKACPKRCASRVALKRHLWKCPSESKENKKLLIENSGQSGAKVMSQQTKHAFKQYRRLLRTLYPIILMQKEKKNKKRTLYKCKLCDKSFRKMKHTKRLLAQHLVTHRAETPYLCFLCGKAFKRPWTFRSHNKSHELEAKFSCSFCTRPFSRRWELYEHEKRNRLETRVPCDKCPVLMSGRCTLQRHAASHKEAIEEQQLRSGANDKAPSQAEGKNPPPPSQKAKIIKGRRISGRKCKLTAKMKENNESESTVESNKPSIKTGRPKKTPQSTPLDAERPKKIMKIDSRKSKVGDDPTPSNSNKSLPGANVEEKAPEEPATDPAANGESNDVDKPLETGRILRNAEEKQKPRAPKRRGKKKKLGRSMGNTQPKAQGILVRQKKRVLEKTTPVLEKRKVILQFSPGPLGLEPPGTSAESETRSGKTEVANKRVTPLSSRRTSLRDRPQKVQSKVKKPPVAKARRQKRRVSDAVVNVTEVLSISEEPTSKSSVEPTLVLASSVDATTEIQVNGMDLVGTSTPESDKVVPEPIPTPPSENKSDADKSPSKKRKRGPLQKLLRKSTRMKSAVVEESSSKKSTRTPRNKAQTEPGPSPSPTTKKTRGTKRGAKQSVPQADTSQRVGPASTELPQLPESVLDLPSSSSKEGNKPPFSPITPTRRKRVFESPERVSSEAAPSRSSSVIKRRGNITSSPPTSSGTSRTPQKTSQDLVASSTPFKTPTKSPSITSSSPSKRLRRDRSASSDAPLPPLRIVTRAKQKTIFSKGKRRARK